ncbi:hypothetical protein LSTR_LSTR000775 [Laodelphax striatellus]|uniref:Uncharacterized protein n=1 Tax=Laodelphax striatellus TaxID=195883 RepID=A0A482XGB3_LAOST|nr:hypothetical protein LSTR_LSTR000775 [Laodelphax striatellus]
MIAGMQAALLTVLVIVCTVHSQAESDDVPVPVVYANGKPAEELEGVIEEELAEDIPKCINGRCKLNFNVLSVPIVQSKLRGLMEIGYNGADDNSISGSTALKYIAQNGREFSFGFGIELDLEGEDKITYRLAVNAGGTIKRYEVKGNRNSKLQPICFPIPGATVVSLCLYVTRYKYHETDKSLELCLLLQLRVTIMGLVGFQVANFHNRCMFLRREHFSGISNRLKALTTFSARNLRQKLQELHHELPASSQAG